MEQHGSAGPHLSEDSRYRHLIEAITDYAIYMLDPDGVVVSWNPGAQRFKGYTADEILGKNFADFFTPEDRAAGRPEAALRQAERVGKFETEGWRVRKDGGRFWAHVVIDTIRDADGSLIGFAKITRDLTERRAAQLALTRSEERFRLLVQSVTDYAIYMLDENGFVTNWNTGAERIKGYSPEEIIGQHFSRFYLEEDRAAGLPQQGLDTAMREGRFETEGWRLRKDGTRFRAHVVIDPIRDDMGVLIGFAKVTRDITERVEAQRTLEKTREAFFQAQKAETLGQLTGGIAHDFNNLLMVVLSSLELLQKRLPDDPKVNRLVSNAVQGAQRGAALTQRMLAFARRQDLRLEAVDLKTLVHGMTDLLERSLGPAVTIGSDFPATLPRINVDANQLELALLNLAVNARDAMDEGGPIRIGAEEASPPENFLPAGRYVRLSVEDKGAGMDERTLSRATEPFFTTKGVGKGTGLGISMVQGMAEQLGGRFALHSQPGQGTVAEIWLPVALSAKPAEKHEAKAPERSSTTQNHGLTVLVVDDDGLVLANIASMLEEAGYAVIQANSGREALARLAQIPIGLVVSDQAMPDMTGSELAETIRKAHPDLPIILASGYADLPLGLPPDITRLTKPFRQQDLLASISASTQQAKVKI